MPDAKLLAQRQSHIRAHESRELDVADTVVARVRPVDPVLLDDGGAEAVAGCDGGDLAGVVGLKAADGD